MNLGVIAVTVIEVEPALACATVMELPVTGFVPTGMVRVPPPPPVQVATTLKG